MGDVLQFYSKSRNVAPGRGAGETVSRDYPLLDKNFRKMLSNFYPVTIQYNGETYASVEHAFHATKLKHFGHPRSVDFAVGAINYVGNEGSSVKKAGGKNGLFRMNNVQIAEWNRISRGVLVELWQEKFGRNAELRKVLKSTGNARLVHDMGRGHTERWVELEALRQTL